MEYQQRTIEEMLDSERTMVLDGVDRYGKYAEHAGTASLFFSKFIDMLLTHDRLVFVQYHALAKKHHTLAWFSTLRLHKVQSAMNLRQVLEAGALAACAIAKPDPYEFISVDENGFISQPKKQVAKLYAWLNQNYPAGSQQIKDIKDQINSTIAHASLIVAASNVESQVGQHLAPFFDLDNDYHVKTDLWRIGTVALAILDLYFGVNLEHRVIKFVSDFESQFRDLHAQSRSLRDEMMETDEYKRAMARIASTASHAP